MKRLRTIDGVTRAYYQTSNNSQCNVAYHYIEKYILKYVVGDLAVMQAALELEDLCVQRCATTVGLYDPAAPVGSNNCLPHPDDSSPDDVPVLQPTPMDDLLQPPAASASSHGAGSARPATASGVV